MWQPEIRICPVKGLYQLIRSGEAGKCAAIISSSNPIWKDLLEGIPYVFCQYEDFDVEIPGRTISQEHAQAIADFLFDLEEQEEPVEILYCCCDAGQSRSPAVASAVSRYLDPVWRNPLYEPNMLVFEKLSEALGMKPSDAEKDTLIEINRMAYKRAFRG